MKTSSTKNRFLVKSGVMVFWLTIWQLSAIMIGQEILLVSPATVGKRLFFLSQSLDFWHSIFNSFLNIVLGFLIACAVGVIFSVLSKLSNIFNELISPVIILMKSTPVASFIILVLLFIPSKYLSACISFIMVTPVVYFNVCQGIDETNQELLEMAKVFKVSGKKVIAGIYYPEVLPYFNSACSISFGIAWKSGIAAEIIGLPANTVGANLYSAKLLLNTADIYAWTAVIILFSMAIEQGIKILFKNKGPLA